MNKRRAGGAGCLLLLPGMMCDGSLWQPQVDRLKQRLDVIVAEFQQQASITEMAHHALGLVPKARRFAVAGLSMGGIVAMELWRLAPERISGIALLNSNHLPDDHEKRSLRDRQVAFAKRGGLYWLLRDELKPAYRKPHQEPSPAILDTIMAMGLSLGPKAFIAQSRALRERVDSSTTLTSMRCPTLILCGEDDGLCTPRRHREMAALAPDAELVIIPGCGHISTLEQPVSVTEAMQRWLDRLAVEQVAQDPPRDSLKSVAP